MHIAMIGTGYVGLVSGACFSAFGHDVICIDKDASKIEALDEGRIPIFEPGLDRLVAENREAGRLFFATDLSDAVGAADAIFLAVGTPRDEADGKADLSYVFSAAREIAAALDGYTVVVTKSTVPVGTGRRVAETIREVRPEADFHMVSNPEFLREGSAIEDFMRPDRVVIGCTGDRPKELMRQIYRPLYLNETPILFSTLETAELTKYAANAFLATKITFINEIADLCEQVGGDVNDVARGIGLDGRIGSKFLHPGPGYGGSCFPKDTDALVQTGREAGSSVRIVETVVEVNATRKKRMAERVVEACGGSVENKTVAVLGLTFKPNTDDMRAAPSLDIVPALQSGGATVRAFDPEGMDAAKELLEGVVWCGDAYDAMREADALVIITEWNQFRALDLTRAKQLMRTPVLVDLRNIYTPKEAALAGFRYSCIGRETATRDGQAERESV